MFYLCRHPEIETPRHYIIPLAGAVIGIITFSQTAAEAEVGRAAVEATPVLSDIVTIAEFTNTSYGAAKAYTAARESTQKIREFEKLAALRMADLETVKAFQNLASRIPVSCPEYVDYTKLAKAASMFRAEVHKLARQRIGEELNYSNYMFLLKRAKEKLQEGLVDAVGQQPQSVQKSGVLQ